MKKLDYVSVLTAAVFFLQGRASAAPPSITAQPLAQSVIQGAGATFSVAASGTAPLYYQWRLNTTNLAGATGSNYTQVVARPADAGNYSVVITNLSGSVTSSAALLTVTAPPWLTQQPANQTVKQGSNATFSVAATGTAPLAYQWYFNGTNSLSKATNTSLTLTNVQTVNVGNYFVVVTNAAGTSTSAVASLMAPILFTNFLNATNLQINGNALTTNTSDGTVLELTRSLGNQGGSAFLKTPVPLENNASFSAFFSFRLSKGGGTADSSDGVLGADGLVFVLQTLTNNVGSVGGGIGYLGITNSVGVEFDTWFNNGDPTKDPGLPAGQTNANGTTNDGNHITLVYNGFITNSSGLKTNSDSVYPHVHISPAMNNSNVWYAWIDYNGGTSNLEARVATNNVRPITPTLASSVNLLGYLGKTNSYVGFTAATGGTYNQQDILTWEVNPRYQPIGVATVPSVSITSPLSNALFTAGAPVALQALATDLGGAITNVQFFNGATLLGAAINGANNTFALAWTNVLIGTNSLKAIAWDNNGLSATSSIVNVIGRNTNAAPVVAAGSNQVITWTEGNASTNVILSGSASDDGLPGGTLATTWSVVSSNGPVTFGNASLTNTTATFTTNGIYVLQLAASDGELSASNQCSITIKRRPFISITWPANNAVFSSGTSLTNTALATDLDGTVTNVQTANVGNYFVVVTKGIGKA